MNDREKGSDPAREVDTTRARVATHQSKRPEGRSTTSPRGTSSTVTERRRVCESCGRFPAVDNAVTCEPCRRAYAEAQHRRREAEWRLPPLEASHVLNLDDVSHVTMVAAEPALLRAVSQ